MTVFHKEKLPEVNLKHPDMPKCKSKVLISVSSLEVEELASSLFFKSSSFDTVASSSFLTSLAVKVFFFLLLAFEVEDFFWSSFSTVGDEDFFWTFSIFEVKTFFFSFFSSEVLKSQRWIWKETKNNGVILFSTLLWTTWRVQESKKLYYTRTYINEVNIYWYNYSRSEANFILFACTCYKVLDS